MSAHAYTDKRETNLEGGVVNNLEQNLNYFKNKLNTTKSALSNDILYYQLEFLTVSNDFTT